MFDRHRNRHLPSAPQRQATKLGNKSRCDICFRNSFFFPDVHDYFFNHVLMRSAAKWRSSRRSSFSMLTEFQPQPKQEEVWNVGAKNRWVIGLSLFCSSNMAIWRDPSFSDPNIWWQRSVGPCGVARFCMLPTMRKYPLTNHAWRRKWDWTHVVLAMPWWHLMPWDAMWCQAYC